jgi:nucleoid-associated protein YgaU
MTADAKIGLLLGLVFIFIIAFIINGVTGPLSHPNAANASSAVAKSNDNPGLAGAAQEAQRKLDWQQELDGRTTSLQVPATTPATADASTQTSAVAKDSTAPDQMPASQTLDDGIKTVVESLTADSGQAKSEVPIDTTGPKPAAEPSPTVAAAGKEKAMPGPTPAVTVRKEAPKEYVVQPGDDLSKIAKKVYGPVDGNRYVNVMRIFQFNRTVLKHEDEVAVGQKLRIPPLPASKPVASTPAKPAGVLPAAQFEQVSAVGESNPLTPKAAVTTAGLSQTGGRWYVVQADDSLWKIAASQLGSGARLEEIVKLNAAVIKNKDNLAVGARLRLPAK